MAKICMQAEGIVRCGNYADEPGDFCWKHKGSKAKPKDREALKLPYGIESLGMRMMLRQGIGKGTYGNKKTDMAMIDAGVVFNIWDDSHSFRTYLLKWEEIGKMFTEAIDMEDQNNGKEKNN